MTSLADYDYHLPNECIAQQAMEPRDQAKLLVYRLSSDTISHIALRILINYYTLTISWY